MTNNHSEISPSNLKVVLIDKWTDFSDFELEWNKFAENSNAHIYQTHSWLYSWWKNYNNPKNDFLYILIFYHGNEIVGIAPFYVQADSLFGKIFYRRLCLLGGGNAFNKSFGIFLDDGPSDYLDVLIKPQYEKIFSEALSNYLTENSQIYDEISLLNIREDSNTYKHLLPELQRKGLSNKISHADVCPYVTTPPSVEKFLNEKNPSIKRRLSQSWKAGREGTIFSVRSALSHEEYDISISSLIKLHQNRWNKIGYPGFFANKNYKNFFDEVILKFYRNNWLWFKTADDGEHCVAGRLAFRFNNRLYDYLTGFDESTPAAKRRPGLALLIEMVDDGIRENIATIDLLRGDEAYKFEFTSTLTHNYNLRIKLPDSENALQSPFLNLLKFISFIRFLLHKEIELVKIQHQSKKFPLFIFTYLKFRAPMLVKKLKTIFHPETD
ncbi:MAG: GNAT family N-acetyltransferase [Ignavibacteriales bacterium]|nr:GNAT family N-acetyltransferase [Ignavibacteriales bacterium]